MLISIFSNMHDNLVNLEKFLAWAKANKVEQLFVLGDICAPATLKEILAPGFSGKIHIVYGNVADRENEMKVAQNFSHLIHYGDLAEFEIDRQKIALTHYPNIAKELAQTAKYDFIFYGHSHQPWIEHIGKTIVSNPGTLAGMFYKATFAVWDTATGKLELKILELIK